MLETSGQPHRRAQARPLQSRESGKPGSHFIIIMHLHSDWHCVNEHANHALHSCQFWRTACDDGTTCVWDFAGSSELPATFTGAVSQDGTRLLLKNKNSFRVLDSASLKSIVPAVQVELPLVEASLSRSGSFALTVAAEYHEFFYCIRF